MKTYAVVSVDGFCPDSVYSIWTKKEDADKELIRLSLAYGEVSFKIFLISNDIKNLGTILSKKLPILSAFWCPFSLLNVDTPRKFDPNNMKEWELDKPFEDRSFLN